MNDDAHSIGGNGAAEILPWTHAADQGTSWQKLLKAVQDQLQVIVGGPGRPVPKRR